MRIKSRSVNTHTLVCITNHTHRMYLRMLKQLSNLHKEQLVKIQQTEWDKLLTSSKNLKSLDRTEAGLILKEQIQERKPNREDSHTGPSRSLLMTWAALKPLHCNIEVSWTSQISTISRKAAQSRLDTGIRICFQWVFRRGCTICSQFTIRWIMSKMLNLYQQRKIKI